MRQNRSVAMLFFIVTLGLSAALAYNRLRVGAGAEAIGMGAGAFILAQAILGFQQRSARQVIRVTSFSKNCSRS